MVTNIYGHMLLTRYSLTLTMTNVLLSSVIKISVNSQKTIPHRLNQNPALALIMKLQSEMVTFSQQKEIEVFTSTEISQMEY